MSFHKLQFSVDEDGTQVGALWELTTSDYKASLSRLIKYLEQLHAGSRSAYLKTHRAAVKASATLVLSGLPSADETFVVNGVTFTAKASGATGNEYNIGASATLTAAAIAAAINASATAGITGVVTASALSGTVTITAVEPGKCGLGFTISESMTNTTKTDFASGSDGTEVVLQLGKSS